MTANREIGKVNLNPLFNAQALYCFYYMALGSYMPFINLYYERLGLSGVQIGTLAAVSELPVMVFSAVMHRHVWTRLHYRIPDRGLSL